MQQQQPIDPQHPLTVTLAAKDWNVVAVALQELPFRVAAPVINSLGEQLQEAQGRLSAESIAERVAQPVDLVVPPAGKPAKKATADNPASAQDHG